MDSEFLDWLIDWEWRATFKMLVRWKKDGVYWAKILDMAGASFVSEFNNWDHPLQTKTCKTMMIMHKSWLYIYNMSLFIYRLMKSGADNF